MKRRYENWLRLDAVIKETNAKADVSDQAEPLRLAHNHFSDLSVPERRSMLGRVPMTANSKRAAPATKSTISDEDLTQYSVDWVAAGKVHPPKDQGSCGSCYAFSGNTALESYIAINEGRDVVHLSEQQIVDCSGSYGNAGCGGGHETLNWSYQNENGALTAE